MHTRHGQQYRRRQYSVSGTSPSRFGSGGQFRPLLLGTECAPRVVAKIEKIRQSLRVFRARPTHPLLGRQRSELTPAECQPACPSGHGAARARASLLSLLLTLAALGGLGGCRPELKVGEWRCNEASAGAGPATTDPIAVPWSTGFEDRFCDYIEQAGFCYDNGNASYELVTTPVHSGNHAAAFRVNTEGGTTRQQARCVRQGVLPSAAYYGAWYFIPATATTDGKVWNLFHFQGGADDGERLRNQWDVSIVNGPNQELQLVVYTPWVPKPFVADEPMPVPIGSWFHIELFLKRAADETGEVALYQDGTLLFDARDILTEDSNFSQWYVGNYSDGMTPPESILYVDDVSIRGQ